MLLVWLRLVVLIQLESGREEARRRNCCNDDDATNELDTDSFTDIWD